MKAENIRQIDDGSANEIALVENVPGKESLELEYEYDAKKGIVRQGQSC
jgi:hypothetical protein